MADSSNIEESGRQPEHQGIDLAKRRLLAGGLFAAPVVMTLTTRPVLARDLPNQPTQDPACASVTMSLAASNPRC